MFAEHQQHLRSQLKHALVNSWNYTEYIPVVPHYLIDNYDSVYYVRYDIRSRLPVPSIGDRYKDYTYISLNLMSFLYEVWEHIEIRGLTRISHVLRTKYNNKTSDMFLLVDIPTMLQLTFD